MFTKYIFLFLLSLFSTSVSFGAIVSLTQLKKGDRCVVLVGCDEVFDENHFRSLKKFLLEYWLDRTLGFGQLFLNGVYDDGTFIDEVRKLHLRSLGPRNPYWNICRLFMPYSDLRLERLQEDVENFIGEIPGHVQKTFVFTNDAYSDSVVEIFKIRGFRIEEDGAQKPGLKSR